MTNTLLIFASAAIGFGAAPWMGFSIGAAMIVLLGLPQRRDFLRRYADQPKTDVYFVMLFEIGLAVAGALASAWVGFGLRYLVAWLQR